jgi:hypothetical protein
MLVTGLQSVTPATTEVIDLGSPTTACKDYFTLPIDPLYGSVAGYGFSDEPLVCGGFQTNNIMHTACYNIVPGTTWMPYPFNLTVPRCPFRPFRPKSFQTNFYPCITDKM